MCNMRQNQIVNKTNLLTGTKSVEIIFISLIKLRNKINYLIKCKHIGLMHSKNICKKNYI